MESAAEPGSNPAAKSLLAESNSESVDAKGPEADPYYIISVRCTNSLTFQSKSPRWSQTNLLHILILYIWSAVLFSMKKLQTSSVSKLIHIHL